MEKRKNLYLKKKVKFKEIIYMIVIQKIMEITIKIQVKIIT